MTAGKGVDYGAIGDDFAFFIRHSNESRAQVAALLPRLHAFVDKTDSRAMLDFGCGEGVFTARLLEAFGSDSKRIALTLAEPVAAHLAKARKADGWSLHRPTRTLSSRETENDQSVLT